MIFYCESSHDSGVIYFRVALSIGSGQRRAECRNDCYGAYVCEGALPNDHIRS